MLFSFLSSQEGAFFIILTSIWAGLQLSLHHLYYPVGVRQETGVKTMGLSRKRTSRLPCIGGSGPKTKDILCLMLFQGISI